MDRVIEVSVKKKNIHVLWSEKNTEREMGKYRGGGGGVRERGETD